MFDHDDDNPSGGYWPSVTDLFITLFVISIVMLGAVFFILLPKNNIASLKAVQVAVGTDFVRVIEPTNRLRVELELKPIHYQSSEQVINDLKKTCVFAVERLRVLKKNDPTGMSSEIDLLKEKIKVLEALVKRLEEKLKKTRGPEDPAELRRQIEQLEKENEELKKENEELRRDSPSVVIGEKREEFRFDSGSSVIKPDFSKALVTQIEGEEAPFLRIAAEIIGRGDRINTLEIIGHTDGVPLSSTGNLDQRLPELLAGALKDPRHLTAGSNNDLGLLRALALKAEWLSYVATYEPIKEREVLQRIKVRCYSAGQTILPTAVENPTPDAFRRNDRSARRIEMRLTRMGDVSANDRSGEIRGAESGNNSTVR